MSRRLGRVALLAAVSLPLAATPSALAQTAPGGTATGNVIVYLDDPDGDGLSAVVLRDLTTGARSTVLPADTVNEWTYFDPELSPDRTSIVLSTDRGTRQGGLGVATVRRDGSGFRQLTDPAQPANALVADVEPAWSPNGATVLFSRLSLGETASAVSSSLQTVPVTGGLVTPVPGAGDGYTGDWSPSGTEVVFASLQDQVRGIGPVRVTGVLPGSARRDLGVTGSHPTWSPDGSTVAVSQVHPTAVAGREGRRIVTVPAAGGDVTPLVRTADIGGHSGAEVPAWAPDGESLLFELYRYGADGVPLQSDLWAVDRNGLRAGVVIGGRGDQSAGAFSGPAPGDVSTGQPSTYRAVTPVRVLDTRNGTGRDGATTKVGAGQEVRLSLDDAAVPDSATAVILNVTVTAPTASTDVRVYPAGTPTPLVSNLNARAGETVPNLVTVALGDEADVVLRNSGGTVHLIADLSGYYLPGDAADGVVVTDPRRVLDTRNATGVGTRTRVPAGGFVDLTVTGPAVPETATAVILNVTATGASATTDVRVYPAGSDDALPEVSNLNLRAGQTAANLVTVAVGEGGKVRLRNGAGNVHLIADLAGYYGPGAAGRFAPISPVRFLDTRTAVGAAPVVTGPGEAVDLKVAGTRGVPAGAAAAVLNLTATGVSASTDVRAYPAGAGAVPDVSNLNLTAGATRANLAVVRTGTDGRVRLRNDSGTVHLLGDLAGIVVPAG